MSTPQTGEPAVPFWLLCVAVALAACSQLTDELVAIWDVISAMAIAQYVWVGVIILSILLAVHEHSASAASPDTAAPSISEKGYAVEHNSRRSRKPRKYPIVEMAKCHNDKDRFRCLYPMLRDEMLDHMRKNNEMPFEATKWVEEMMDYTVPGGKLNRGTTVMSCYRALHPNQELSETELARAAVLGWAIEFLQAFFLVADDLMDDSQTRRGQPCWYKLPKVQLIAINDSFILESFVFGILRDHFQDEDCYADLLELFLDVTQKTEFGQLLDLTSQPMDVGAKGGSKIDLDRFTIQRYKSIVKYKTAFYSFYLPVAVGMLLSGKYKGDRKAFDSARRVLMLMGEYFQVQDDYLDCYGDPQVIGKVGTDIQDNKCGWLVVQALDRCNAAQRKIIEQNYGDWNDKKVAKIKALYKELKLAELFHAYEEESYKAIQRELDSVTNIPRDVFELLLKKIYKRSK